MTADDREARIRELLPLVKRIARRVHRLVPSVELDDLIGDGSIGLIRAVDQFDEMRGPTLEQYARQLVAGAMLNGIRRMDPVSERARRALRDGETERYRIAVERGEVPSVDHMDRLRPGYARATVAAHRAQPLSLDAPLPEGESIPSDWSGDPGTIVERREERTRIHQSIAALPPRQQGVVARHYFEERSLREIGRAMAISPQRASQLHLAAVIRLKKQLDAAAH
jgi:RNA polymerase sigma factor for flagellar operon FliA